MERPTTKHSGTGNHSYPLPRSAHKRPTLRPEWGRDSTSRTADTGQFEVPPSLTTNLQKTPETSGFSRAPKILLEDDSSSDHAYLSRPNESNIPTGSGGFRSISVLPQGRISDGHPDTTQASFRQKPVNQRSGSGRIQLPPVQERNGPSRKKLMLIAASGTAAFAVASLLFIQIGGSDQQAEARNQLWLGSTATPSTLETQIVDLDEVADEDTLRLEIPLEASDARTESGVEVDVSLSPLKFTIADGQVLLTGTAQSEDQAAAMVERASVVFAGVELVADYEVNPAAPRPVSGVVVQKPVVFETGSAAIRPEYYAVLDACAQVLASQPSLVMSVAGHTDNVGSEQINLLLAEQRAQAVIDYYVSKGLDGEQFERLAIGDTAPISSNDTEAGRQDNRRTDLEFEGIFDNVIEASDG